jgi:glycosyltransferase involved in cell wall biosynthesis
LVFFFPAVALKVSIDGTDGVARDVDISVILTTYQRPENLRRSLLSLAVQRGVEGRFELVVTDDGSTDNTADIVSDFASSVSFPVQFVTQEHDGFRAARVRNNGVRASSGRYIVFVDGDCVVPPYHVERHIRARRQGVARSGDAYRLDEATSARIDQQSIISGEFLQWVPRKERWRLSQRRLKDELYYAVRHPFTPRLVGCNVGLWRADIERINGFDESFVGWGCEDDDLGQRLRQAGVRVATILGYTTPLHLWHRMDPSQPTTWGKGLNVALVRRTDRPTRCEVGLAAPG